MSYVPPSRRRRERQSLALALGGTTATFLTLDLIWLGLIARPLYQRALAPIARPTAYAPAAILFYAFYTSFLVLAAIRPASCARDAAKRGASLGLFAYATYELTNWAVLSGWSAWIVPVDVAWGTFVTAAAAFAGRSFYEWRAT